MLPTSGGRKRESKKLTFEDFIWDLKAKIMVKDENLKSKPLKDAVRKLRKRIRITVEMKDFEDKIACLEKSNSELTRLRKQINELQAPSCCAIKRSSGRARKRSVEFGAYGTIRRASKALHEALIATWSDTQAPHPRHLVKLFLDAKVETDVEIDIAILCYSNDSQQWPLVESRLTRVQVRSRTMDSIIWSHEDLLAPPPKMDEVQRGQRKRQKVSFASISESPEIASEASPAASAVSIATSQSSAAPPDDIKLTGHFCSELSKRCLAPDAAYSRESLGHIDSGTQEAFRHRFFPGSQASHCNTVDLDVVMFMSEVLGPSTHYRLDIVTQLRLAHRLVSAVLKFNATPWLDEMWNIEDLAFFRQGEDLIESLQTLHFDRDLCHKVPGSEDNAMEVESPTNLVHLSTEDAQYKHGVRNVTLFSLGAALLAIGRWERVDHNDIEGIRRLASQRSYLGPVYQELTQKVLDCDFGYGKDLKKPRLQEAVYEKVVLELDSMIASLDISRD
jgi:hypothetical protein